MKTANPRPPFASLEERAAHFERQVDTLTTLVAAMLYDVGQLPFVAARDIPAAHALQADYEAVSKWFSEEGYRL